MKNITIIGILTLKIETKLQIVQINPKNIIHYNKYNGTVDHRHKMVVTYTTARKIASCYI